MHQTGSHIILETEEPSHQRIAVPAHKPLRIGTLNAILRAAVAEAPNNLRFTYSLATLLATCQDESVRDGREAVALAERAAEMTAYKNPEVLATLAAAHAEAGAFSEAVDVATTALELAESAGETRLSESIRVQLQGYSARRPYRNPDY